MKTSIAGIALAIFLGSVSSYASAANLESAEPVFQLVATSSQTPVPKHKSKAKPAKKVVQRSNTGFVNGATGSGKPGTGGPGAGAGTNSTGVNGPNGPENIPDKQ